MIRNKARKSVILLPALSIMLCAACSTRSVPPEPESTTGMYVSTGFEFYRWEAGLRLMIWIEGIESSGCATTTIFDSYELRCYAFGRDKMRFDWHVMTDDGIDAEFSINQETYNLADGYVFLLTSPNGESSVKQLKRDLSGLPPTAASVTEFGLSDAAISELFQVPPKIADCLSSSTVPIAGSQESRIETAKEVLRTYFKLLYEGEYGRAAAYYGGDYELLRDHNPGVAPDDYAALFHNACTINGAQCLKVRRLTFLDLPSPAEFRFAVQFANKDGSLFWRGPCCGDDRPEMQRQDEFIYTVRIECTGKYLVMETPVYVP